MRISDWSSDVCSSDLTGAPELLAREMAALRRRTKRIVWLNPMIGWEGYEPAAGGMQAALPYVDLFAPAHNLKNLEALAPYLETLGWETTTQGCCNLWRSSAARRSPTCWPPSSSPLRPTPPRRGPRRW